MIDATVPSCVTLAVISVVFIECCFKVRARCFNTIDRYLPLPKLEHHISKCKEVALIYFSYDSSGWLSLFLLFPMIVKWSWNFLGINQMQPCQPVKQHNQHVYEGIQEDNTSVEAIDLDYEKHQPYVRAAMLKYPDLTDEELLHALKDLQNQGKLSSRSAMDLFNTLENLRFNGHEVPEVPSTYRQLQHTRDELVDILSANRYERRDIEDVINRYREKYGCIPTMEEFVEFHDGLRADLESKLHIEKKKLEEKNRKVADKDKALEENHRALEENHRALEDKDRTIEDKDRTIEDKDRTIEDKDRTIEENHRAIRDLEIKVTRSLCKLCMVEEVSILCMPCGHLYCCNSDQCRGQLNKQKKCHMCGHCIVNQFSITLS